jgi:hypothetical protein
MAVPLHKSAMLEKISSMLPNFWKVCESNGESSLFFA